MPPTVLFAVISITTALVLYSVVMWRVWKHPPLRVGTLVILWLAFCCDYLGTALMRALIEQPRWDLHSLSGYIALALMLGACAWGTFLVWRRDESQRQGFVTLYFPLWLLWLLAYITGVFVGMQKIGS